MMQFLFDLRHGQRDRKMSAVSGADAIFDIAEIAGHGAFTERRLLSFRMNAIMPREIEYPCKTRLFTHGDSFRAKPIGKERSPAAGVDHHIGIEFLAQPRTLADEPLDGKLIALPAGGQPAHDD